jgi:hypothetical protein
MKPCDDHSSHHSQINNVLDCSGIGDDLSAILNFISTPSSKLDHFQDRHAEHMKHANQSLASENLRAQSSKLLCHRKSRQNN